MLRQSLSTIKLTSKLAKLVNEVFINRLASASLKTIADGWSVLRSMCRETMCEYYIEMDIVGYQKKSLIPKYLFFLQMVHPHSVPLQYFTRKLQQARTFHDVYRIFYGEYLTDDVIESLLTSPSQGQYYHGVVGRPRIGGLPDTMAYGVNRPSIQGTNPNVMLDSPVRLCEKCVIIPKTLALPSPHARPHPKRHHHLRRRRRRERKKKLQLENSEKASREMGGQGRKQEKRIKRGKDYGCEQGT